jgi:hypothetical protein
MWLGAFGAHEAGNRTRTANTTHARPARCRPQSGCARRTAVEVEELPVRHRGRWIQASKALILVLSALSSRLSAFGSQLRGTLERRVLLERKDSPLLHCQRCQAHPLNRLGTRVGLGTLAINASAPVAQRAAQLAGRPISDTPRPRVAREARQSRRTVGGFRLWPTQQVQ